MNKISFENFYLFYLLNGLPICVVHIFERHCDQRQAGILGSDARKEWMQPVNRFSIINYFHFRTGKSIGESKAEFKFRTHNIL